MIEWSLTLDTNDAEAYAAFATDRIWCGYALADLDQPFRAHSKVAVARHGRDVAACLVLRHPAFAAVVPHGPHDGVVKLMEHIDLPDAAHLFAREEHLTALRLRFEYPEPTPMYRMAVQSRTFRPVSGSVERL